MDLPNIVRTLRAADSKGAHTTAVAGLLFLLARAFKHLPPHLSLFDFTVAPAEEVAGAANAKQGGGGGGSNGGMSVANSTSTADSFSRAGSAGGGAGGAGGPSSVQAALSALLASLSSADIEAFSPELRAALDSWPSASKHHKLLRLAQQGGSGMMVTSSSAGGVAVAGASNFAAMAAAAAAAGATPSAAGISAMHVVPLVEAAQGWADCFPLVHHGGDADIAAEARDNALAAAVAPVAANAGAVLQFICSASVLPHMARDTCRSLLLCARLLPNAAAAAASAAASGAAAAASSAPAATSGFWAAGLAGFADMLLLKRATLTNAQSVQTAEALLRDVLARGLLKPEVFAAAAAKKDGGEEESAERKASKAVLAAWAHLLVTWASLVFDPAHRRTHRTRASVGLLAVPEAQYLARRRSPLFSDSVRRLATAIINSGGGADVARFAFAFATGDAAAVEAVDATLTNSSLPMRARSYVRGRLGVASALIFWENRLRVAASASSSSSSSSSAGGDGSKAALKMPFNFVHLTADQHPGLIDEVWPPAPIIAAPHFAQEAAARYPGLVKKKQSSAAAASAASDDAADGEGGKINNRANLKQQAKITIEGLSFCDGAEAAEIAETVVDKLKLLRTSPQSVKDLVLVSQFAVAPARFAAEVQKLNGGLQWDSLLECFVSNSQNIHPGVAEMVLAPAVAEWTASASEDEDKKKVVALLAAVNTFYTSRCNSGNEKASLLLLLAAVLRRYGAAAAQHAAADSAGSNALVQLFRTCLASPSPALLNAAWAVFAQLPLAFQKSAAIAPFLKPLLAASSSAAQKRACLAYADAELGAQLAPLHTHLLDSVEDEILTALPDAFLSLAFSDSAASKKLAAQQKSAAAAGSGSKSDNGSDDDGEGSDDDAKEQVKAWASAPECVLALVASPAPEEQIFDPAAGISSDSSSAAPAAGAGAAAGALRNMRRLAEANSALAWRVLQRGLGIAQSLADQHLACGPLVTFIASKRGLARELAARIVLGTHRLRTEKPPKKRNKKKQMKQQQQRKPAAATTAPAAAATAAAPAVSLLSSAPRALSAWKFLSTTLLPFVERRLTAAAGPSSAARELRAGIVNACRKAAEFAGGSGAAEETVAALHVAIETANGASGSGAAAAGAASSGSSALDVELREAVTLLARGVLAHIHVTDPGDTIAAILSACAHPAIIGCVDADFEAPSCRLIGRYRPDSITPMLRTARAIFGAPLGATLNGGTTSGGGASNSGDGIVVGARAMRDINPFAQHVIDNGVAVAQSLCAVLTAPSPSMVAKKQKAASQQQQQKGGKPGGKKGGGAAAAASAAADQQAQQAQHHVRTSTTEAKRSAARAFSLLQAYVDGQTQLMTAQLLLNTALRGTVDAKFCDAAVLDPYAQAAMQPDVVHAFRRIFLAELFKKGLLKNHGDRPPKGVNNDDWKDACRREDKKAIDGMVEKFAALLERTLDVATLDRVAALLVPFAAVRHLASLPRQLVSLDSVSALLPFLMEESDSLRSGAHLRGNNGGGEGGAASAAAADDGNKIEFSVAQVVVCPGAPEDIIPDETRRGKPVEFASLLLAAECTEDAACSLLKLTPLRPTASSLVRVYRLLGREMFDAPVVGEANAFAHALRLSVTNMLPPELVPPLLLVARRFFRVFRRRGAKMPSAAAQHQFMSVLATCFGDRNIGGKLDAAELLFLIAENHFGLHRMTVNSITALCGHLSPSEAAPVTRVALTGGDIGRECALQGLGPFCKQFGLTSRLGGVVASAACFDAKNSVATLAQQLVAAIKFEPREDDWLTVCDLLNKYHASSNAVKGLAQYALVIARKCNGEEIDAVLASTNAGAGKAETNNQSYVTSAVGAAPAASTSAAAAAATKKANAAAAAASLIQKSDVVSTQWLPSILLMPRTSATAALDVLAPTLTDDAAVKALDFLSAIIEDSSSDVAAIRACSTAGSNIVASCSDAAIAKVIATLKPRLKKSTSSVPGHRELHNGANIALLTALATRTNDAKELDYVLDEVVAMCAASTTAYVHRVACDCVRRLAETKALRRSDKIVEIGNAALKSIMAATVYAKKKGHGYIYTGLCAGAGLLFLRRTDFMETVGAAARDRQQQRMGAMILLDCCCETIGEMFEPYALALTPMLIDGIAEKDDKIAECADDAAKSFMRCMSEAGLHQLIPKLIEALSGERSDSKKRAPALNLIGYTAFCSPKQLVATLPSIMQHIMDALCDANINISRAAYSALRRVAGVVSNEEVRGHVDILLEAMRNPADETENALDALLYTRFFTRVDPASLAILAPVVLRGLGENGSEVRGKAAQIVESLVRLVLEEKSLVPYSDEFIKKLQNVVTDPSAAVRSVASKAMASLAATIGDDRIMSVIVWCLQLIVRAGSSAERSGAAEAFCEAVARGGPARFAALHGEIAAGLRNDNAQTRMGFVNIIVYTPSAFAENMFTPLLPTLFDWVLTGLGDSVESVRTMALAAGSTIITGYGTRTLQFVLGPLVDGVSSENSATRQACLLLTAKLIVHLTQVLRRQHRLKNNIDDDDEDEDENGGGKKGGGGGGSDDEEVGRPDNENEAAAKVQAVSAREAERATGFSVLAGLRETIGDDRFVRIMAALHIARFEHNANVRAEVHSAWTIAVSSMRTAVNLSIGGIVDLCVKYASSENPECNDLAERILEFTAQRLHETLDVFLLSFSKKYEIDDLRHKVGALACMAEVVPCCDADRIHRLGPHLVRCVLDGLQHEDERARTCAGAVFDRVSKIVGGKWIDSMVEQQLNTSVVGVVELVRVRPVSSLASIFKAYAAKVTDADVTAHDVRLLKALIELEDTRQELTKHYDKISSMLLAAERAGLPEAAPAMTAFGESLVYEYCGAPVGDISRALKTPESRAGAIRSAASFFFGVRAKYADILEALLRMVVHHMSDVLPDVRDAAARSLQQMISSLDGKASQLFTTEERADMLLAKGASGRYALQYLDALTSSLSAIVQATLTSDDKVFAPFGNPVVFDALFTHYFIKYIEHGRPAQKVQALEGIHHMLAHSKAEAVIPCLVSIGGKCVRFLTSKQEGPVLSATMHLVAFLMTIKGGGKEVVFENTLAASLCATMLCDSTEAKLTADIVALQLVNKNNTNAEKLLGGIGARKGNVESEAHRASLSRFITVVVRAAQLERKAVALPQLVQMVRGYYDAPDNAVVATAAGSCMGVLVMNTHALVDSDVAALTQSAIAAIRSKAGNKAIAGIAFLASAIHNGKSLARIRAVFEPFADNLPAAVQAAIESCGSDRTVAAWTLRLAAVTARVSVLGHKPAMDAVLKLARGLHKSDEMLHGALDFFVTSLPKDAATAGGADTKRFVEDVSAVYHAKTKVCEELGLYEFDVEDELGADCKYF